MRHYFFEQMMHIDRFNLTVKRLRKGQSMSMNFHNHDFSEIAVVTGTENTLHWCGGKSHALVPGDVILIHPGPVHAYENTAGLELVNIIYDSSQLPLPQLDGGDLNFFQALVNGNYLSENPERPLLHLGEKELEEVKSFIERMEKELQEARPGNRLCIFGLFLSLLIFIARAGGETKQNYVDSSASRALHYINLHFKENINIEFLARMCNLSRTGFFVAFRELCGYSPIEYQQEKRLALAVELLRSSSRTLGEIASECGFCDSNYLSKLFSRKFGVSPGRLRKSLKQQ